MNALTPFEPRPRPVLTVGEDRLFDSLNELKDLLIRRKFGLLACVGGCVLLACGYLAVTPNSYTAVATLMIDSQRPDAVHQVSGIQDAQVLNAMVESEVEILHSEGLAREVVDRLGLTSNPSFAGVTRAEGKTDWNGDRLREQAAQQLLRMTSIKRIGMTYVIEVDVTAGAAREAAVLANGVTDAYLAMQVRTQGSNTRQAADWLSQQMEALRQRALNADEAVQAFKAASGIVDTDQGSLDKEQAATLENQLLTATSRTAQTQARVDQLSVVLREDDVSGGGVSDLIQDPVLTTLQQRYFEVAQRQAELAARYGRSHAIVVKLTNQMAELRLSAHQEVVRLAAAAQSDLAVARAGEATIRSQLAALIGQAGNAGAARAKLRSLESSAAIYRAVYTNSLQHYAQSMQDSSFPVVAAHVVTAAEPPLAKSKPRRLFVLMGAAVVGVAGGISLALVLEFLDQTLVSAAQVERALGVPCLARLPRLVWRRRSVRQAIPLMTVLTDLPQSRFSMETRRLRLRVLQHVDGKPCRVIGVVASRGGDGVSIVAHNLSSALMESGRSVALISLQEARFGHTPRTRPSPTSANALAVFDLKSGPAGDLIRRLENLRDMHDVVVLDLPPLFELDGADDVVRALGSVVLVARSGVTRARDLIDLVDGSGLDWSCIAGVVLNCADTEIVREIRH